MAEDNKGNGNNGNGNQQEDKSRNFFEQLGDTLGAFFGGGSGATPEDMNIITQTPGNMTAGQLRGELMADMSRGRKAGMDLFDPNGS